jgi:hypothetical protein
VPLKATRNTLRNSDSWTAGARGAGSQSTGIEARENNHRFGAVNGAEESDSLMIKEEFHFTLVNYEIGDLHRALILLYKELRENQEDLESFRSLVKKLGFPQIG